MRKILAALFIIYPAVAFAAGPVALVNETGLAYNNTYAQNTAAYGSPNGVVRTLSAQITFSSATISSATFSDGGQSTASITINTNNILAIAATTQITLPTTQQILGQSATDQITVSAVTGLGTGAAGSLNVANNAGVTGVILSLYNGTTLIWNFTNGSNWQSASTSSGTASNLATAINSVASATNILASWPGGTSTLVYATSTVMGTGSNSFGIQSSSPSAISSATFTGGVNPATIKVNGNVLTNGNQWSAQATSSMTALSIANAINTYITGVQVSTLTIGTGIVYASATVIGTQGNVFTATSSVSGSISVASATFTGGANRDLNGDAVIVNGTYGYNDISWTDASNTSSGTAASIAAWINSFGVIQATATSGNPAVIYATATVPGLAGNSFSIDDTDLIMTEPSLFFTGGQDNASVKINGKTFTAGINFSTGTTATIATNLATAVTNSSSTIGVTASPSSNVITLSSVANGFLSNYALATSSQAALQLSPPVTINAGAATGTMTGGTSAGTSIGSPLIAVPQSFTKALPVLYTTTKPLAPLVTGTTYFVIPITNTTIELAYTSTGAIANLPIVITSSSTQTTADSYGLVPLAFIQGSAGGNWQVSNDGLNYANYQVTVENVAVSSQTFTPSGVTTLIQEFGPVDYGYLRYNVTGPTQGGVALKVILNGKD